MKIASSILLVFAVLLVAPKATAETGPWQTVPENGIISKPGRYLVDHDIVTDRTTGIKIDADNVTLDLGGHAVRYTGEPKPGSFGIASPGRKRIAVYNGTIGNFWFNMHCTQNEKLRIRDLHFDNIPYIGVNVAQSNDVVISDNRFDNFRYDLPKDEINHYLVAINIGAKSAVITNNQFIADPQMAASDVDIETVCVLFSAEVTKECLVAKNVIEASDVLPKSYGIWLATNGQATIVDNTIRNMKYGVCLAGNASALVGYNRFNAESKSNPPIETIGISASGAKEVLNIKNSFEGVNVPVTAPPTKDSVKTTGG
ncbi:MAG: right-handed parallel beta-helix repeat-containing protein [Burkholderiales bacterium]